MTNAYLNPVEVRERVKDKGTKFATVTFTKKDGSTRAHTATSEAHQEATQ